MHNAPSTQTALYLHSTFYTAHFFTQMSKHDERETKCANHNEGMKNSIQKNSNSWSQCPILPTARLYHRTSLPVVLQVLEQVVIWVFLQPAYLDQMDPMWRQHALVQQCSDGWMEQHFVVWQNCQKDDKMTYIWFPPLPPKSSLDPPASTTHLKQIWKTLKIDIQH